MNDLINKLTKGKPVLLYGLTPPKDSHDEEKIRRISERRISRISQVDIDGLVIYDIQEESARTDKLRPFPFISTVDSLIYKEKYMAPLNLPTITYSCVGKYTRAQMIRRCESLKGEAAVFVGASSRSESVRCSISQAYDLVQDSPGPFMGAVAIPERHSVKGDEHKRMIRKQSRGVNFFISQFVFNGEACKNMLSDYYYTCCREKRAMAPVIFTVTPCATPKSVEFLRWMGVDVPAWVENEIIHAGNALEVSLDLCMNLVDDLSRFCLARGIPFGCNVESVSLDREGVMASFDLVNRIGAKFRSLAIGR